MNSYFFGFGSLVNTGTHKYRHVTPATIKGWERYWVSCDAFPFVVLSVRPAPSKSIQGLIAEVPGNDWAALDEREAGYQRRPLTSKELEPTLLNTLQDVQMYVQKNPWSTTQKPILRSYLETVLFGYYQVFGEMGVDAFLATTNDQTFILDDREQPVYPRYRPPQGAAIDIVIPRVDTLQHSK